MGNLYVLFVDSFLLRDPLKKKQKNMSKKRHFQQLRVARGDTDLSKQHHRQMPYEKGGGGTESERYTIYLRSCMYICCIFSIRSSGFRANASGDHGSKCAHVPNPTCGCFHETQLSRLINISYKKKRSPNYRYKKCTRQGFVRYKKLVPGTKVLFPGFMTHGRLESRKAERCSFCLPCQCRTRDQENAILPTKHTF